MSSTFPNNFPSLRKTLTVLLGISLIFQSISAAPLLPSPRSISPGLKKVVIFEDIHLNTEAQKDISQKLRNLIDNKQVGLIAAEGAFGPFEFSPFRSFPDKSVTEEVADLFLSKNWMGAVSHAGILSAKNPPAVIGVDHYPSYLNNVQAYLDGQPRQEDLLHQLHQEKRQIDEKKAELFSDRLMVFDQWVQSFHREDLSLNEFVNQSLGHFPSLILKPNLQKLSLAIQMEESFPLETIDLERKQVVQTLGAVLTKDEAERWVSLSENPTLYYWYFSYLLNKYRIPQKAWSSLKDYMDYVFFLDQIDLRAIEKEVDLFIKEGYKQLNPSHEAQVLIDQDERIRLSQNLVQFQLTPYQWDQYQKGNSNPTLNDFENFYRSADIRTREMVQNILREGEKLSSAQSQTAVLLSGGFHSPSFVEKFSAHGVEVVIKTPQLSSLNPEEGAQYLSLFSKEKTPLEFILEAEDLFILPAFLALGTKGTNQFPVKNGLFRQVQEALLKLKKLKTESVRVSNSNGETFFSTHRGFQSFFYIQQGDPLPLKDLTLYRWVRIDEVFQKVTSVLIQSYKDRQPISFGTIRRLLGNLLALGFAMTFLSWIEVEAPAKGMILGAISLFAFPKDIEEAKKNWLQDNYSHLVDRRVAEISMEFAPLLEMLGQLDSTYSEKKETLIEDIKVWVSMAQSAGGIGPLVSERFVEQADLGGAPMAVVPLYNRVYVQSQNKSQFDLGEPIESGKFLRSITEFMGISFMIPFQGEEIQVNVRSFQYKKGVIYFLDAQDVFDVLYQGKEGQVERNRQEWVLGRGALRLFKKLKEEGFIDRAPGFLVLSENPTVAASPRLFMDEFQDDPFFDEMLTIFNDHTPLEYAHLTLTLKQVKELGIDPIFFLSLPVWVKGMNKENMSLTTLGVFQTSMMKPSSLI